MTERVDCLVIGAGVIGLAVARRLALAGREVIVLEAAEAIGTQTSARNSEVIHAGIYYAKGSLKARLCVAGRKALYAYCTSRGVAHKRLGKFIVATSEAQLPELARLQAAAAANGVVDLERWDKAALARAEPAVSCVAGLWSPSTGIIDSHALMLAYQGEAEARGAVVALHAPVTGGHIAGGRIIIEVGGAAPIRLSAGCVVNSGGLWAPGIARSITGIAPRTIPQGYMAKGNYYALAGRPPFTRPIYPVPEAAGLGVHATVDLAGQVRFGPDVEWIEAIDYDVDPARAEKFYAAVRRYYPDLADGALRPDYAGIRPKIQAPGGPVHDFVIHGRRDHGVDGLVNLFGIESPGLTASLAIADHVAALIEDG
jgi:L-2-hydroxyglutarate oxidase LhgO